MKNAFELIIFDCDGTLVDSERLYAGITSDILKENGLEGYEPDDCLAEFQGRSWTSIRQTLEERHQTTLCDDVVDRYVTVAREKMKTHLKPIDHAHTLVDAVKGSHAICIGSNGERQNVLQSLSLVKLDHHFPEEIIFTKCQVANAKPAPDLFLHAAKTMGHDPGRTLVIEDSISGVQAGVAAGMHVIGFTGSAHDVKAAEVKLKDAGAHTIMDQLRHIPDWLNHTIA